MVRLQVANITKPFGVSPEGWLSRYCQGSCGKVLKSRKQKVSTEEKLALVLHRSFLILLGKPPLRSIGIKLL
jgi:hypothetical protein